MSRPRHRTALVGAGVIGAHHALVMAGLVDRLDLVAVIDPVTERAQGLAVQHGARPFGSLTEALRAVDLDLVVVCTPTGEHGRMAIEALNAGKHVVLEKPAETTTDRIDQIIAAQRAAGTVVTVISQHRFDPATRVALAAIRAGELGRLTSGVASIDWWREQGYYDSGAWRGTWDLDGGGALMNQGVHVVDLLVTALGEPEEVFAYTATLAHSRIEVEDVAAAVVRFAGGALGVLHATTAAYPGLTARLQVHGDAGSVIIEDDVLTVLHTTPAGAPGHPRPATGRPANQAFEHPEATTPGITAGNDPAALSGAHRLQYENFLDALDGNGTVEVDLAAGRRSVAVITGAYASARSGTPVRLR